MKRAIPFAIGMILLTALAASVPGKGKPVPSLAEFEFDAVTDTLSTTPSPSHFKTGDIGWEGNDWGYYIREQNSEHVLFVLGTADGPMEIAGTWRSGHIEVKNHIIQGPLFDFTIRGPNGEVYLIKARSGRRIDEHTLVSMTYDPDTAYGSWTIVVDKAPFSDITAGEKILGYVTGKFVVTRTQKQTG